MKAASGKGAPAGKQDSGGKGEVDKSSQDFKKAVKEEVKRQMKGGKGDHDHQK